MIACNEAEASPGRISKTERGLFVVILLALFGATFDRRELSVPESRVAAGVLAPLDGESVAAPAPDGPRRVQQILTAWASATGTTERALRLAAVCALLLSAFALGAAARQRAGLALILAGVAALLALFDGPRLAGALLAPLPVAICALASLPRARFGGGIALGGAWLCAGLGGTAALIPLVLAPLFALAAWQRRDRLGAGLVSLLAVMPIAALLSGWGNLEWPPGGSSASASWDPAPHAAWVFACSALGAAALLAATVGFGGARSRWLPGLIVVACTALVILEARCGNASSALAWATAAAVVLAGIETPAPARMLVIAGSAGSLAAALLAIGIFAQQRIQAAPGTTTEHRATLDRAGQLLRSGGRLILEGPDRFALLYYARRGHDPRVPIILVPEQVRREDLRAALAAAFGHRLGAEEWPPTLWLSPAESAPPGLYAGPSPHPRLRWLRAQ